MESLDFAYSPVFGIPRTQIVRTSKIFTQHAQKSMKILRGSQVFIVYAKNGEFFVRGQLKKPLHAECFAPGNKKRSVRTKRIKRIIRFGLFHNE